jgi:hypothetical protein
MFEVLALDGQGTRATLAPTTLFAILRSAWPVRPSGTASSDARVAAMSPGRRQTTSL